MGSQREISYPFTTLCDRSFCWSFIFDLFAICDRDSLKLFFPLMTYCRRLLEVLTFRLEIFRINRIRILNANSYYLSFRDTNFLIRWKFCSVGLPHPNYKYIFPLCNTWKFFMKIVHLGLKVQRLITTYS